VAFTLDDLERFVRAVENDYVREGLPQRLEVARISGLFGANVVTGFIKATLEDRGAIIFNLSEISHWERKIAVEFILGRLVRLGQPRSLRQSHCFWKGHSSTSGEII
jgi:hypothetical protein